MTKKPIEEPEEPMVAEDLSAIEREWIAAELQARLGRPKKLAEFLRNHWKLVPEVDLRFVADLLEAPPTAHRGPRPKLGVYDAARRGVLEPICELLTIHGPAYSMPNLYQLRDHLSPPKKHHGRPAKPTLHKQVTAMTVCARINYLMARGRSKAFALDEVRGELHLSASQVEKLDALGRKLMASISPWLVEGR
jgi:hypothetical protein